METTFKKISDIIDNDEKCPLPLEVIPNHMGINLCSVEAISWQKQSDGQLTKLTIHFSPNNNRNNFLALFNNIKKCKALDCKERLILSQIASFQIQGDMCDQTDSGMGSELGMSAAQIGKNISRLKKRGEIDVKTEHQPNPNGGRPIPKRFIKIIDLAKWTTGNEIPKVKGIV